MSGGWSVVSSPSASGGGWSVVKPSVTENIDQTKPEAPKGLLGRLWDTLTTPSGGTTAGRVKMGVGDPAVGGLQLAQHIFGTQAAYEAGLDDPAGAAKTATQNVDKMVGDRERRYEEQRRQAVPGSSDPEARMVEPKLGMDWARLVGNVASPVNAVTAAAAGPVGGAAARGLPLASRLLPAARVGALAGGLGGATQPVTEPGNSFGTQKAGQMIAGGALGAGVGAAAPAVGAGLGAAGRTFLGRPVANAADQALGKQFAQGVGIPSRGINNAPDLVQAQQNAASAVRSIIGNQDNLTLAGPGGVEIHGQLPQTRGQFAEAIHQTKEAIFKRFDALAKRADASTSATPAPIIKFQNALQKAVRDEGEARVQLAEAARPLSVNNPERTQSEYARQITVMERAQRTLNRAIADKAEAQKNLSRPWVDLKPIASDITSNVNSVENRLYSKSAVDYAMKKAEQFTQDEALTGSQTQALIKNFNEGLKAFYTNPSYETASHAYVDAMIVSRLRKGLDEMVERTTGGEYQALKNEYGALSSVEKQVTNAARTALNQGPGESLVGRFADVSSIEQLLHGIVTRSPSQIGRAVLIRAAKTIEARMNSPDRAISAMFQRAQREMNPQPGIGLGRAYAPAAAGTLPQMPATEKRSGIGDRGPNGGIITAQHSTPMPAAMLP